MRVWRYNWLRKRGYKTIAGQNRASDLGTIWVELIMTNGKNIKHVKAPRPSEGWHIYQELEKAADKMAGDEK